MSMFHSKPADTVTPSDHKASTTIEAPSRCPICSLIWMRRLRAGLSSLLIVVSRLCSTTLVGLRLPAMMLAVSSLNAASSRLRPVSMRRRWNLQLSRLTGCAVHNWAKACRRQQFLMA